MALNQLKGDLVDRLALASAVDQWDLVEAKDLAAAQESVACLVLVLTNQLKTRTIFMMASLSLVKIPTLMVSALDLDLGLIGKHSNLMKKIFISRNSVNLL